MSLICESVNFEWGFPQKYYIVSLKIGDTIEYEGHCLHLQRFSCVKPASHISFWISFKLCKWLAMAEIWPPCSFGSPGVKIRLWGIKNIKNFDYCLCSSYTEQFLSDLYYIWCMNWWLLFIFISADLSVS